MELLVTKKQLIAEDTMAVTLEVTAGKYDAATPGAHITLQLGPYERSYTLTRGFSADEPYEIQVLRVSNGRGGSMWVHDTLAIGDKVQCIGVSNEFPLESGGSPSVFIAGGIGITPFLSMGHALHTRGEPFVLHHLVRDVARQVPLSEDVQANLQTHIGVVPDFKEFLKNSDPSSHIYTCGPVGMMSAVRQAALDLGFPSSQFHTESFGGVSTSGDQPIEVHLALSGITFTAPSGKPLLDSLLEQGAWVGEECRRGQCGSCLVEVVEGEPVHRDALDPNMRPGSMCTCVSWAKGPRLVLNL